MFERMVERVRRQAERRVEAQVLELTERLQAELPPGIAVEGGEGAVRLIGKDLRRRFVLEPALRWMRLR